VKVSAELAFENSRETRRVYDNDQKALVSERIESTKSTGRGVAVGGAAGSASNAPGQGGQGPASAAEESKAENIDTRYLVSESVRETVNRGASIQRLKVAAFVDRSALAAGEDDGGSGEESAEQSSSTPTLEEIRQIISDAVGLDESRGDSLQIVDCSFRAAQPQLLAGASAPTWMIGAGRYVAIAMVALVLLLVARRVLKGLESAAPKQVLIPEIVGAESDEMGGAGLTHDELVRREIARFVEKSPETASRLIEGWVEGEE
jgi:flagellar M-ring protein FliF